MKVVQPITIDDSNIIDSNCFDTIPNIYYSGSTYALGAYTAVAGNGSYLVYRSLQNSNLGNDPATSPLWWVYSSFVYASFGQGNLYALGDRVYDAATNGIWESLAPSNTNVLDPVATVPWVNVGTNASTLPAVWSNATTYAIGDYVYSTSSVLGGSFGESNTVLKNVVHISLQAGNLNHSPPLGHSLDDAYWASVPTFPVPYINTVSYGSGRVVYTADTTLWQTPYGVRGVTPALEYTTTWLKIKTANKLAMFDSQSFTSSSANKMISVTVATGIIDTAGLINVNADLAVITVRSSLGGTIVYEKTIGLAGGNPTNAWDYYFADPTIRVTQTLVDGIPPYPNCHVTVTLTGSGEISLGNLLFGKSKDIGLAEYGVQAGILDYSGKTTDSFGQTSFIQRGFKKRVTCRAFVDNDDLNQIQNTLYALRATPCLWILSNDPKLAEALIIYGFYKDFSTEISYPTVSYINYEIEGLI